MAIARKQKVGLLNRELKELEAKIDVLSDQLEDATRRKRELRDLIRTEAFRPLVGKEVRQTSRDIGEYLAEDPRGVLVEVVDGPYCIVDIPGTGRVKLHVMEVGTATEGDQEMLRQLKSSL